MSPGSTGRIEITVSAASAGETTAVADQIAVLLRSRHKIVPGQDDDFSVRTAEEIADIRTAAMGTMTTLLAGIAVLARTNDQLVPIEDALSTAAIATQRAVGRSPLELALSDAYRTTSREALALWADEQFTHHDPIRRRVAEEVDRFITSQEPGGFRSWVDARTPFDDLDTDMSVGAVSLLTFHGAKGREWPVVVVAGAGDAVAIEKYLVPGVLQRLGDLLGQDMRFR